MLAAALQAEVTAHVDQFVDENGHRLVVRNGYHEPRDVVTAAGAVPVRQPRVDDRRIDPETGERARFASSILPARARKSPGVAEVLSLLYLHELSSQDFGRALEQFLGSIPGRVGLRVRVGRRDPPQGPARPGQGVPAGHRRCPRGWHQGAGRAR
jgi:hypothetical protein